jgi:hypothetical protein
MKNGYLAVLYCLEPLFLEYFDCVTLAVVFASAFVYLCVIALVEVLSLGYSKRTQIVFVIKVRLKSDLLKPRFQHLEHHLFRNKLIQVTLGFDDESLESGLPVSCLPKPLDMSRGQKLQYNVRLFAIRLAIDYNLLGREIKVEILFSSKQASLL